MRSSDIVIHTFLLLALLVGLGLGIEANCQTLRSQVVLVNLPKERQLYNLSDIFRGYSLSYQLFTDSSDKVTLYAPFRRINVTDIEQPLHLSTSLRDVDQTRVTMDILTDSNLAWREQGSSLVQRSPSAISVQFGQLNKYMHLTFTLNMDIDLDENETCFDISSLDVNITLVDCQVMKEGQPVDVHHIVNATDGTVTNYSHDSVENIYINFKRKTLIYIVNDTQYMLSAALYNFGDLNQTVGTPIPTYVAVYQLNQSNSWKPRLIHIINEQALNVTDKMVLTDMTIDAQNYIYLTDKMAKITRFRYTPNRQILYELSTFKEDVATSYHKVAAIYDYRGRTSVMITSSNSILELDWSRSTTQQPNNVKIVQRYEVPLNTTRIEDLQVNRDVILLQADSHFYFYRRDLVRLKYLLCVNDTFGALGMLDQVTPNTVIVGREQSISYVVSSGYLSIEDPETDQNFTVKANSGDLSCSATVKLIVVQDASHVIPVRDLKNYSYETPAEINLPLHSYFFGSRLNYSVTTVPEVATSITHIENVTVAMPDEIRQGFSLVDTFMMNDTAYYRISSNGSIIHVDICSAADAENEFVCNLLRSIEFDGEVIHSAIYPMLDFQDDRIENIALMGCVLNNSQTILRMREIRSGQAYPDLLVSDISNITDIEINSQFIIATCSELQAVFMYHIMPNVQGYVLVTTITYGTISTQMEELTTFEPLQCILAPWDPNLLFIRNIDCIIILKVTTGGITVLSSIPIEKEFMNKQWRIVISSVLNLLLIQEGRDQLFEYSLVDLYHPFLLRVISLMGSTVKEPIHLDASSNSDFVYIKTSYKQEGNEKFGISMIKLGASAINSYYAYISMETSRFSMASIELDDSSMIEVLGRESTDSRRIYFQPTLKLQASIDTNITQKSINISLSVSCPTEIQVFKSILRVINYQLPLAATYGDKLQLYTNYSDDSAASFQLNSTNMRMDLFKGSVASYSAECGPEFTNCVGMGPARFLRSIYSRNRMVQFMPFDNGTLLWTLDITGSISISRLNIGSEPECVVQADTNATCLNWVFFTGGLNEYVLVHCRNRTSQYFAWYQIESSKPQFKKYWMINDKDWIGNPLKMDVVNNRLFILDSTAAGPTNGTIQVLRIDTIFNTITWERVIDATDFDLSGTASRLNDFEILPTWDWSSSWMMLLVTVDNVGLAYGFFDSNSPLLNLEPKGSFVLMDDIRIEPFELDDTRFLQLELISVKGLQQTVQYDIIVTVSHGRHLQLLMEVDVASRVKYKPISTYRKYGSLVPHNWARSVIAHSGSIPANVKHDYLLLSYREKQEEGKLAMNALVLHRVSQNPEDQLNQAIAVIRVARMNTSSAAAILRDDILGITYLVVTEDNNTFSLYTLHDGISLQFSYEPNQVAEVSYTVSTNVRITASNMLSQVTTTLPIDLTVVLPPLPNKIEWYEMLSILSGVMLIMVTAFLLCRYRKRKLRKRSSLSNSSQRSSATEYMI